MIKQLAFILLSAALALGFYGFFIAQRVVGWLYVVPAAFLSLLAVILFFVGNLRKRNR